MDPRDAHVGDTAGVIRCGCTCSIQHHALRVSLTPSLSCGNGNDSAAGLLFLIALATLRVCE